MKKIIGILAVLFITISVFGQNMGFEKGEFFSNWLNYRFEKDEIRYVIAYEDIFTGESNRTCLISPNDIVERNLRLYRKIGDKWEIASDIIKTDFWKIENGVKSFDFYADNDLSSVERKCDLNELLPLGGNGLNRYSGVEIREDGALDIHMLNFYGVLDESEEYFIRWDVYRLVEREGGMYYKKKVNRGHGYSSTLQ